LDFDFFHDEVFFGESFLFLDVYVSSRGSLGGVTSPYLCLSSSPSSSSFSTSSPSPPSGESDAVSSDALCISFTYSFLLLLLLLGASYTSHVTTGLPMRSGLYSYVRSTGTKNSLGHSLVISSISSLVIW
jgi:hypothetical protein